MVGIGTIKTHTMGVTLLVELSAHDIPPFAEVHDAVMKLARPALRGYAMALAVGHSASLRAEKRPRPDLHVTD